MEPKAPGQTPEKVALGKRKTGPGAEAEAGVFAASGGDIVGPIKEDDLFTVYKVLRVINPELDDVKDVIRDRIFEEFTEGLTGTAVIEVMPLGTRQEPVDDSDDEE